MITLAILKYFFASSIFPESLAEIAAFLNWFCRFNRNVAFCSERLCMDTTNIIVSQIMKTFCFTWANASNLMLANASCKFARNSSYVIITCALCSCSWMATRVWFPPRHINRQRHQLTAWGQHCSNSPQKVATYRWSRPGNQMSNTQC